MSEISVSLGKTIDDRDIVVLRDSLKELTRGDRNIRIYSVSDKKFI